MLPTNPKTNPIFQRLTRYPFASLTLRQAAWLMGVLSFLMLAISLGLSFTDLGTTAPWLFLYFLLAWLLYLTAPLFAAVMAAAVTGHDAGTDLYRLMRQTPVTRTNIVYGYISAVFFRLRVLLVIMIGLLPALVFGIILVEADSTLLLPDLGTALALVVGLWGAFLLGVVVGVLEGLLLKKVFPGVIAAPLLVILAGVSLVCGSRPLFSFLSALPIVGTPPGFIATMAGLIALSPYLLSLLFFRLACRWV